MAKDVMTLDPIAKGLIIVGICLIFLGIAWQMGWLQSLRLGRLPGDIAIERENVHIYIPLTTGLLLSTLFALISWLFKKS